MHTMVYIYVCVLYKHLAWCRCVHTVCGYRCVCCISTWLGVGVCMQYIVYQMYKHLEVCTYSGVYVYYYIYMCVGLGLV